MNRITITDEDGQPAGWFDSHAAKSWEEATTHDGRNFISDATGSQWDHEKLFRTAKGAWVLNAWSQWRGSRDTCAQSAASLRVRPGSRSARVRWSVSFRRISDTEAAAWLVLNGHEPPKVLR